MSRGNSIHRLAEAGEKAAGDFRSLATHAENLLKATKAVTGEGIDTARERLTESLQQARDHLTETERSLIARGREATQAADTYVHEHPWQVAASALAVGVLIGVVSSRSIEDSNRSGKATRH